MIYQYRWLLLTIFVAGVIILLLPDKGKPVIELNAMHGPSLPDIVGLSLIFIGWLGSLLIVIQTWRQLTMKPGKRGVYSMLFIYLLSIAGVIAGLNLSTEWILWACVIIAATMNLLIFIAALRITGKQIKDAEG